MLNSPKNKFRLAALVITNLLSIGTNAYSTNHTAATTSLSNACASTYIITPQRQQFIDRISKLIVAKNASILKQRAHLQQLLKQKQSGGQWNTQQQQYLKSLTKTYRVKYSTTPEVITQLLNKINIIPKEIVLAQAIIESKWGESRFYKQGNNLFGMHCFSANCGIAPRGLKNPKFNVSTYNNDAASLDAYYRNINRHYAYTKFRDVRHAMLNNGAAGNINSAKLIQTLDTYSEIGKKYTSIINKTITCHQLSLLKPEKASLNNKLSKATE